MKINITCKYCGKEKVAKWYKPKPPPKYCSIQCCNQDKRRNPFRSENGYVVSCVSGIGKILEHRWVMQQYLGRQLNSHEDVHHINGNRADNRLENL